MLTHMTPTKQTHTESRHTPLSSNNVLTLTMLPMLCFFHRWCLSFNSDSYLQLHFHKSVHDCTALPTTWHRLVTWYVMLYIVTWPSLKVIKAFSDWHTSAFCRGQTHVSIPTILLHREAPYVAFLDCFPNQPNLPSENGAQNFINTRIFIWKVFSVNAQVKRKLNLKNKGRKKSLTQSNKCPQTFQKKATHPPETAE